MLGFFRRGGVAQVVVGAVAVTIMIVFALEFRPGRDAAARISQDCALKVYNLCVDQKEYLAAYGLVIPYGTSPKAIKQLGLRRQIMDGLTERQLLLNEAERLGLGVSEAAVEDELAQGRFHVSLPAAARTLSRQLILCKVDAMSDQCEPGSEMLRYVPDVKSVESGEFDYKKYERIVRNIANRGPREFKEMQERELLAERLRDLVRARVRVSVDEARLQFERERSKATVRAAAVNRDWFAKYTADLADAAVTAWALQNKAPIDASWETEKTSFAADCPLVSEILLPFSPDLSDDEKAALRVKLEQAEKRLKEGASFESLARQLSEGPNATSGGYLGCLNDSYGAGAVELLQALNTLKPGGVSGILTTPRGLHVLKFHGKLKKEDIETTGRHAVATRLFTSFTAGELAKQFAMQLIDKLKHGAKLEQAVHDQSEELLSKLPKDTREAALSDDSRPKVEISAPFTQLGSPITDALPSEGAAGKAFALDKPDAFHPEPIATERGFAVMQLKEKELSSPEQFEKERAQLMRSMQHIKASDALVRYVAQLRKAAGDKVKVDTRLIEDPAIKDQGDS